MNVHSPVGSIKETKQINVFTSVPSLPCILEQLVTGTSEAKSSSVLTDAQSAQVLAAVSALDTQDGNYEIEQTTLEERCP